MTPESSQQFCEPATSAIRALCGEQRRLDVSSIRRSLADAMLAWPGPVSERWWKWVVETCRTHGYAARVIDAAPAEVHELLRHGTAVMTWSDAGSRQPSQLLILNGVRRRKFRLIEFPGQAGSRWVSSGQLQALTNQEGSGLRRWVILDLMADDVSPVDSEGAATGHGHHSGHNGHGAGHGGSGHGHHPSPWQRLRQFLQPELSDIWVIIIFALVTGMLTLATPIAVEALVNTVAFGTLLQPLIVLSIILLTFLIFAASLRFLQRFVIELIQRRLMARVAARLAWQLPRIHIGSAHDYSPELLNRFFDIVTMQKIVAQLLLDGLTVVLTIGLGMIVLAFYHPWLLAFDAVLLALLVLTVFVLGRGAVDSSIRESRSKYAVAGWLETIARCRTMFKGPGGAEFAMDRIDQLTTDYLLARQAHFRVLMRQIISGLAMEAFASAALLGLGGFLVVQGQMTLGQLVAAELIVTMIVAAVAKFDKHLEGVYDLLTSMDKLGHVFDLPVESSSGLMNIGRMGACRISVRDLEHHWDDGRTGLSRISFEANAGEMIAVTGPSGCGKSTLLNLIFRSHEPAHGRLLLDDHDLSDIRPDVLRQHMAFVKDVEILEGTIAENVHLSRPDISTSDVRQALRKVGLAAATEQHDASEAGRTHWSLQTVLTHEGRPLSATQTLRLTLARALAGKPGLLLIDCTLDPLTEEDARFLIEQMRTLKDTTTILIATSHQRIAALCDRTVHLTAISSGDHGSHSNHSAGH